MAKVLTGDYLSAAPAVPVRFPRCSGAQGGQALARGAHKFFIGQLG